MRILLVLLLLCSTASAQVLDGDDFMEQIHAYARQFCTPERASTVALSALVGSLVQKGLVSQAEEPGDRRQKALRATPAGLAALARIEPVRRRANQALLADFEPSEISLVLSILRSCLDVLWSAGLSEAERQRLANGSGDDDAARRENRAGTVAE